MKKKLLFFVGVLGVLAGSLAYTQGGDNVPEPILDPARAPLDPNIIEDREVIGRWTERKNNGEYGLWYFLQRRDGRVLAAPIEWQVQMEDGGFKDIEDVQIGERFYTPPRGQ